MNEYTLTRYNSTDSFNECFICMENLDEPIFNLLDFEVNRNCHCKAYLHGSCYKKWLRQNNSCPICRIPISSTPIEEFPLVIVDNQQNNCRGLIQFICGCFVIIVLVAVTIFVSAH